jgi:ubiquinone biosynthesis protein
LVEAPTPTLPRTAGKGEQGTLADIARQTQTRRYREISQVLARHGLGFFISITGLERFVPLQRVFNRGYEQPLSRPEHVRAALEELGPTFIKLGQILSTRADLLPSSYQAELAKLQDAAPPLKATVVEAVIQTELGRPVDAVFRRFDPVPLAAASIGQVHAATLSDGTDVVVKVQRPGVVEQVERDLQVLHSLATTASRRWPLADEYAVVGLVQEFAQTLRGETDYLREGRNAERFGENFARDPTVHFPCVFWNYTTARVLTLERINGIKIDDFAALDAAGVDRARIAANGATMVLKMIFRDRFFHADPHPGNFFIEREERIGVVDFGMVGTVGPRIQEQLVWALLAYTSEDPERQVDMMYEMGVAGHHVDRTALRRDVEQLRARYYGRPVGEIAIRPVVNDVLGVVRRHRLHLPAGYALLLKTVLMHESLVTRLDPQFEFTAVLVPYARRMLLRHFSPAGWGPSVAQAGIDLVRLGVELPQQLRRLMSSLQRGDLELAVRPTGFAPLIRRLERIANRIVLGMIAGAFVVGLAVLLAAYHVRSDSTMGIVLVTGFVLASVLGIYVAWSILRSGRP